MDDGLIYCHLPVQVVNHPSKVIEIQMKKAGFHHDAGQVSYHIVFLSFRLLPGCRLTLFQLYRGITFSIYLYSSIYFSSVLTCQDWSGTHSH